MVDLPVAVELEAVVDDLVPLDMGFLLQLLVALEMRGCHCSPRILRTFPSQQHLLLHQQLLLHILRTVYSLARAD